MYNMGRRSSTDLSVKSRLLLCLCFCCLSIHLFVDVSGHRNIQDLFQQIAEHRGELDHSDYEHEDDFVPFSLASKASNTLAAKAIAANLMAFSRSICPLLLPPITA